MKRLFCLMIAVILFLLPACTETVGEAENITFYYIHNDIEFGSESGVITPTVVQIKNKTKDYRQLLDRYFNGPTNYDCVSPFPAGITLEDLQIDNNKVQLLLSPHMSVLSGVDFTIACACLTRTVIEMTGVQYVQIQIENNLIYGQDSVTFNLSSFSYWDNADY